MARMRITVTDDGGPVRGRLGVQCSPGPHNGERFVHVEIGALDLSVAGADEIAAERCQAIASEFHRMALELLRTTIAAPPPSTFPDHIRGDGAGVIRRPTS